jgi:hypothetical protein
VWKVFIICPLQKSSLSLAGPYGSRLFVLKGFDQDIGQGHRHLKAALGKDFTSSLVAGQWLPSVL